MSVVRTHTYSVAEADLEEFLARRAGLIGTVREICPGLTHAVLIQLDDGTYRDTWHWEDTGRLEAASRAVAGLPEVPPAMALTKDLSTQDGHVVDER
ncbi:hypothetical protein [Nonomuraea soli]|uniref:ABM domain-containing protein n=1 Tax=Nonomuraea soli TaxID=1032476 RepID=A0A7W0CFQ9_9ACTN|nr:hypothetical protein [Nonomuraea soli]MBA2890325.1 hypothetical protein [Nonomuraea soli]